MTEQIREIIYYEGKKHFLNIYPLESKFNEENPRPNFFPYWTGIWRGYMATWEIDSDKLYLIDITAWFRALSKKDELRGIIKKSGLNQVFPGNNEKIFASWFSGQICIPSDPPKGKQLLENVGKGPVHKPIYLRELILTVENGRIIKKEFMDHTKLSYLFPFLRNKIL